MTLNGKPAPAATSMQIPDVSDHTLISDPAGQKTVLLPPWRVGLEQRHECNHSTQKQKGSLWFHAYPLSQSSLPPLGKRSSGVVSQHWF